jgi:hypothetical protein
MPLPQMSDPIGLKAALFISKLNAHVVQPGFATFEMDDQIH